MVGVSAAEDGCVGMEGGSGIVIKIVCEDDMKNLGGRMVLMLMRTGILVGEVIVLTVGVTVLMAVGVISFFEKRCLSLMEVECLEVSFGLVRGNIYYLGGDFVAVLVEMEVDDLELEVGTVIRLVWGCLNLRLYFLWCLSNVSGSENV